MKVILLAAFLVVMQTAPPVPQEASDSKTAKSQSPQHNADSSKKPAEEPPPAAQTSAKQNDQKPIKVVDLPPVSITRDRFDYIALVLSIGLLIVGVCGVLAAYRTLRAIEAQVRAQEEALRARITIDFHENVFRAILHDGRVNVVAKFVNTGGTPAYRVVPETWIEFVSRFNDEVRDFTANAVHHVSNPIAVYPTAPTLFDIPLGRRASQDEIAGLRRATTTLAVRIRLTYESIGKPYFVDRAFSALPDGMRFDPRHNEAD